MAECRIEIALIEHGKHARQIAGMLSADQIGELRGPKSARQKVTEGAAAPGDSRLALDRRCRRPRRAGSSGSRASSPDVANRHERVAQPGEPGPATRPSTA